MENTIDVGRAAGLSLPDPSGELSDAELEFVVGGLTRAWSLTPEGAVPAVSPLAHPSDPVLKPSSV